MPLNSVAPVATTPGTINQQDFLKILMTELNAQDPLKPMDNTAFVAQLAQFAQLEQTQALAATASQLLAVQTAIETMTLLGHKVAVSNGGSYATGTVTDVLMTGTSPVITVHPSSGSDVTGVALPSVLDIQ